MKEELQRHGDDINVLDSRQTWCVFRVNEFLQQIFKGQEDSLFSYHHHY